MPSFPLRLVHAAMALLFLFAATLQYNDADALPWIAMYVAAAVPCILVVVGRPRRVLAIGVGVIALLWSVVYLVHGAAGVAPSAMFAEWTMSNDRVREARELYGLGLIALVMLVSVLTTRTKPRVG
jgi:hypothetical protein